MEQDKTTTNDGRGKRGRKNKQTGHNAGANETQPPDFLCFFFFFFLHFSRHNFFFFLNLISHPHPLILCHPHSLCVRARPLTPCESQCRAPADAETPRAGAQQFPPALIRHKSKSPARRRPARACASVSHARSPGLAGGASRCDARSLDDRHHPLRAIHHHHPHHRRRR
jgi:hypothetical protein